MPEIAFSQKALLIARLAGARTRLLHTLLGIDEHTLTEVPIFGKWTASNILVHIGEYDWLYGNCVQYALEGTLLEHTIDYDRVDNDTLRERVGTWTLQQSLEYFTPMRARYLDLLAQVPDDSLNTVQRGGRQSGSQRRRMRDSIKTWTKGRFDHDAAHTIDLKRWRRRLPDTDQVGPNAVLIAVLKAANADLELTCDLIPDAQRTTLPITGFWTNREVFAHVADWRKNTLYVIGAALGEETPAPYDYDNLDDWNAQMQKAHEGQSWEQILREFQTINDALIDKLHSMSQQDLGRRCYNGATIYQMIWSSLEHYEEHTTMIRDDLHLDVPKSLLRFRGKYGGYD